MQTNGTNYENIRDQDNSKSRNGGEHKIVIVVLLLVRPYHGKSHALYAPSDFIRWKNVDHKPLFFWIIFFMLVFKIVIFILLFRFLIMSRNCLMCVCTMGSFGKTM